MEQDIERKVWTLMVRYISNDLSLEETEELMDWVGEIPERTAVLQDLHDTWEKTRFYPVAVGENGQLIWNSLRVLIEETEQKKLSLLQQLKTLLPGMLAVLLLLGTLAYYVLSFRPELMVQTHADENIRLTLPEGSFALLNQESKLSYEYGMLGNPKNEVTLVGSAFFKAQSNKGTDLCILLEHGLVRAKFARFFIDQENENFVRVIVFEGRLKVATKGNIINAEQIVGNQEALLYPNGRMEIKAFKANAPAYLKYNQR